MSRRVSVKSLVGATLLSVALWVYATLNTRMTALVEFPIAVTLPGDRAAEGELPAVVHVKIRASGWELLNIRYFGSNPQCMIDLAAANSGTSGFSITKNDILQSLHPAISLDKVVEVSPENFNIATSAVVEKRVPVRPQIKIQPRQGFIIVGGLIVRPDSITIRGNAALMQNIWEWKTGMAEVKDVAEAFGVSLQLSDSLQNKVSFTKQPINVAADVQLMAEQTVDDIPVELLNVPANADHRIVPRKISITVRGGVANISALMPEMFKVQIDYAALRNDTTGVIVPTITTPPNVEILKLEPRFLYHLQTTVANTEQLQVHGSRKAY